MADHSIITRTETPEENARLLADIEQLTHRLSEIRTAISKVIYGQKSVIDQTLISFLAGGHVLLIGVPGLAKTLLVETLGTVLGLDAKRIQCTPDLMPSDIIGSEILEEDEIGKRHFRFLEGPVFSQLLMADEINRASPRTQSALLQAMQEKHVSVAGHTHNLPRPFHVLATQNPLEQEGTYPLPEAQLDRFLMQIDIHYPDQEAERAMLVHTTSAQQNEAYTVLNPEELINAQNLIRRVPVGDAVVNTILTLVREGRPENSSLEIVKKYLAWGPGPRASQSLLLAAKARAVMEGRLSPSVDDVIALAYPVLQHRMARKFSARADNITQRQIIDALCDHAKMAG